MHDFLNISEKRLIFSDVNVARRLFELKFHLFSRISETGLNISRPCQEYPEVKRRAIVHELLLRREEGS